MYSYILTHFNSSTGGRHFNFPKLHSYCTIFWEYRLLWNEQNNCNRGNGTSPQSISLRMPTAATTRGLLRADVAMAGTSREDLGIWKLYFSGVKGVMPQPHSRTYGVIPLALTWQWLRVPRTHCFLPLWETMRAVSFVSDFGLSFARYKVRCPSSPVTAIQTTCSHTRWCLVSVKILCSTTLCLCGCDFPKLPTFAYATPKTKGIEEDNPARLTQFWSMRKILPMGMGIKGAQIT